MVEAECWEGGPPGGIWELPEKASRRRWRFGSKFSQRKKRRAGPSEAARPVPAVWGTVWKVQRGRRRGTEPQGLPGSLLVLPRRFPYLTFSHPSLTSAERFL